MSSTITLAAVIVIGVLLMSLISAAAARSGRTATRQVLLLLASYLFYSIFGWGFLSVLIASSIVNFAVGSALRRTLSVRVLWLGIALNVLLLAFFKYLPPIVDAYAPVSRHAGLAARYLVMPIGISFWTFQALSYLIDTYLEEELDPTLLEFCLYMAFWPTVLSGPVCRLPKMLPQFRSTLAVTANDVSTGALWIAQGLFMKLYLAQLLASGWTRGEGVVAGFDRMTAGWGAADVWLLGIGYGFQLFFDFGGYSLIAMGAARLFGIRIPRNFDRPFLSTTPAVFWTRWHMSLSFWIRDYVFKPLAVARRDAWWPYASLLMSMALFGLWHGAKWTFVVWGVYHGSVLVLHRIGQRVRPRASIHLPRSLGTFATFLLVAIGFVIFRANDVSQAFVMVRTLMAPSAYGQFAMPRNFYLLVGTVAAAYFIFAAVAAVLSSLRSRYADADALFDYAAARMWWWLGPAVAWMAVLVAVAVYGQRAVVTVTPFIYTLF